MDSTGTYLVTETVTTDADEAKLGKGHATIVAGKGQRVTAAEAKRLGIPEKLLEPIGVSAGVHLAADTTATSNDSSDEPPAKSANKADQLAWAVDAGLDVNEDNTKDEIRDAIDEHVAALEAAAAADDDS